MRRLARWAVLAICLFCLGKALFWGGGALTLAGFFISGAVWYLLAWLKARELDGPYAERPRS